MIENNNNAEYKRYTDERIRNDSKGDHIRSSYDNKQYNNYKNRKPKLSHNILPPPRIIEAYDEISPGSASQLFEMAISEQKHRHNWENQYLNKHIKSYRLGQIFSFITSILLIVSTVFLVDRGYNDIAKYLPISGFSAIIIISILSARGRKFARRPSNNYNADNR